ncbi:hypothetical protein ABZP36_021945 [Zizania latifolia]
MMVFFSSIRSAESAPSGGMDNGVCVSLRPMPAASLTPASSSSSPPPTPSLSQAEEGVSAADSREEEELREAKAKANLEVGAMAVVFGFAVLSGWLCLPKEAKRPSHTGFTVSLLLAFATFVIGKCLMLLSMSMLGLPARLVSGGQRVAACCLYILCVLLSAMTLVSLLVLLPGKLDFCISVAVLTVVALPVASAHWYVRRRAGGDNDSAAAALDEHEELETASKTTSSVTNSAFGGLVGVLAGASSKATGATTTRAAATPFAIFFMFATAILGMFLMTVPKRVLEVPNPRFRRFLVRAIRVANAFLLCLLACAAFAASFVVLGFRMLASLTPLAITALVYLQLQNCMPRRGGRRASLTNDQEAPLKVIENIASKVTAATFAGIMSVLGGSLGEEDRRKPGPLVVVMLILTSAFVSGFGFMLLEAVPAGSLAKARLAPAAKVLAWSSMALFAGTTVAVYGAQAWRI